jgi:hypothetical protein
MDVRRTSGSNYSCGVPDNAIARAGRDGDCCSGRNDRHKPELGNGDHDRQHRHDDGDPARNNDTPAGDAPGQPADPVSFTHSRRARMSVRTIMFATSVAALVLSGCNSQQPPASAGTTAPASTDASAGGSAGTTTGTGAAPAPATGSGSGSGTSIPTLVNVNLQNVLNNLSVSLNVARNNIPVSAQVPIDVAANVCGVSVTALAASIASGSAGCTATTTSPQLTQLVQQQIASGGSVTGGAQTMGGTGTTTTPPPPPPQQPQ